MSSIRLLKNFSSLKPADIAAYIASFCTNDFTRRTYACKKQGGKSLLITDHSSLITHFYDRRCI